MIMVMPDIVRCSPLLISETGLFCNREKIYCSVQHHFSASADDQVLADTVKSSGKMLSTALARHWQQRWKYALSSAGKMISTLLA